MTTVIGVRFPWGRYHATPWDHSANEAIVEWPPSPWRLLRAFYCTWRFRAPYLDEKAVMRVLRPLAAPPSYALPPHLEAHTRHYMPDIASGADKVFDPFVVTARGAELLVKWEVDLDDPARVVLADILGKLPYLGRADSVCEARLIAEEPAAGRWIGPGIDAVREDVLATRVLASDEPLDVAALVLSTTSVRRLGRLTPPGTRLVEYSPLPVAPGQAMRRRAETNKAEVVRLVIDGSAVPSLHASVAVCDLLRRAAMASFGVPASSILAGKSVSSQPLVGHRHAHYLGLDLDSDRLLDHLIVWAPGGLGSHEIAALTRLRRLSSNHAIDGVRPIRLAVEAVGVATAVVPELVGPARSWRSHTPFAPSRHQPKRQSYEEFLRDEVARELSYRDLPPADVAAPLRGDWLTFRRRRLGERIGDDRRALGLRLEFPEPVTGPISLGSLSHFGLGVFLPSR